MSINIVKGNLKMVKIKNQLRYFYTSNKLNQNVVLLNGVRTPFCRSATKYQDYDILSLVSNCLVELKYRNKIKQGDIDYCYIGNSIQNAKHLNIAREAVSLDSELIDIPGQTINAPCVASLLATTMAFDSIRSKLFKSVISGGVEFMTDLPLRLPKSSRRILIDSTNKLSIPEYLFNKLSDIFISFKVDIPTFKEVTTQRTMIDECELMCRIHGISRSEVDSYAQMSLKRTIDAVNNHKNTDIIPIYLDKEVVSCDNIIQTISSQPLENLSPVSSFARKIITRKCKKYPISTYGINTSGNSTTLTDGAATTILMDKSFALSNGYTPCAYVKGYEISAHNPLSQSLLGPAYAIPKLLHKFGLKYDDIGIYEIHEAFAGQILCLLKYLNDQQFISKSLSLPCKLGEITQYQINQWGGSLYYGHPLAATGTRLINMAVNQLNQSTSKYALVSACSAGGQSIAILLERYD